MRRGVSLTFPCWRCRHPDARDATHARGCPKLPAVTDEQMRELAAVCARGWIEDEQARRAAEAKARARRAPAAPPAFTPARNVREAVENWRTIGV